MATAFAFVWLVTSAGGARAAAVGVTSFSTSGVITAVVVTFISTLVAVTIVIFLCLFLPRKHLRKKEARVHGSPNFETGVGRRGSLESNGRNIPPGSSDDVECRSRVHQDHVTVVPVDQTASGISQRTLSKKRLNKVNSSPQKMNHEVKTNNSVSASANDQKKRPEGEIDNNRKLVKPSVSYDGRLPLAYSGLNDEETSVTLVSRDPIGLGFNIYGNMTEGIFVREVLSRGPAVESGLISQGDRILSISISTAHMVLEDALTILSYASSYPVTLRISKTIGQDTLFTPSGQLPSDEEVGASTTDVRLRERGSRRPSVNPLYRSQSLDNLADLKADADRSISEFRSSADHLTRRFSEFRASPECLRRNIRKPSAALHRWNLQLQQKLDLERLDGTDAVESTPECEGLAVDGTRKTVCGEPCGPNQATNCGGTSEENTEEIAHVDFEQTMQHSAANLTNQATPKEEVSALIKDVSNIQDNRIRLTKTVVNRPKVSNDEEVDGLHKSVSNEDTRITDIDDFEGKVTDVRYQDHIEIENNDKTHAVKNDFMVPGVFTSPRLGGMDSSVSRARLDVERSNLEHSGYVLTGKSGVDEPLNRLQHSAVAVSSNNKDYAMNKQTCDSETRTISGGKSSDIRSENNTGVEDRMAEQLRNVAVTFDEKEKSDAKGPGISGLKALGGVENVVEIHENSIDQRVARLATSSVERSAVIRVNKNPSTVYSSSPEQTTIEVIESSQLQPTNGSPSSKGFLKTLKRFFNFGQNNPGDGETSLDEKTLNKTGKRKIRKSDKAFLASTGKTRGSNSNGRDVAAVVHSETVRQLSFAVVKDDDNVFEEDIDKVIADFMGLSSQAGQSETREVSSQMELNQATGDGLTKDSKSAVAVVVMEDPNGASNIPFELKLEICQSSSQSRAETGIADEAAGWDVTELDREAVGNCIREQLDQGIVLENADDVTINRQSEISRETNDSSDQMEIVSVISTDQESNYSPTETSMKLEDREQISVVRSVNDSSAETQQLEPMNVASSSAHSNPFPPITVISPVLKKFQTDIHNTKVIKPILKKLPSVSNSENCSTQDTDLLTKTPSIPNDQIDVQQTYTSSTSDQGHTKNIPNVIPKVVTTPDERRAIQEAIGGGGVEVAQVVTYNKRARAADSDRLVENEAETFRELQNQKHAKDSEEEESEIDADLPWTARAPPSYANHHEMVKTESDVDDSRDSVPVPNYALLPESFETESDKEETWSSTVIANYANYPDEIEDESEKDVLSIDTTEPNCVNYFGVTNVGFGIGERDTLPAGQCDNGDSLLDAISDISVALRDENQDPEGSTAAVSDCNNEPKTPVEVVKSLLEKLQSFGKRNSRDGANGNVVSDGSRVLSQPYNSQNISIPCAVKNGDGSREDYYNECEDNGASDIDTFGASDIDTIFGASDIDTFGASDIDTCGASDTDTFGSKNTLSNRKPIESNIDSDVIVCENDGESIKLSERNEVFLSDYAGERPRVVFDPTTIVRSNGYDEINTEQRCTPKSVGDINNNNDSCLSG